MVSLFAAHVMLTYHHADNKIGLLVLWAGVEPARTEIHYIPSAACLPFHHHSIDFSSPVFTESHGACYILVRNLARRYKHF